MLVSDIDVVSSIYAEVLDPTYISYSELGEGKAEAFGKLSENAPAIFREQLVKLQDSDRHGFFVASVNDDVIGFALASLHQVEAGHLECWLDDIGVSPEWQRRGIARAMIAHVFEWGALAGAKYYLLESGVQNEGAHHLFESLGFQPLSTVFWRERSR